MTETETTKIEAVNQILQGLGRARTNQIGAGAQGFAVQAEGALDEASKAIQSKGWYFNCDYDVELTADSNGEYVLGADVVKISHGRGTLDLVKRGRLLYDRKDQTSTFTVGNTVKINQVRLLPWNDTPESFRTYAIKMALRVLVERLFGDQARSQQALRDELQASSCLAQDQDENENFTIFDNWEHAASVQVRSSPLDSFEGSY